MTATFAGESAEYRAARNRLLEPLWNVFDPTPEGRPSDWHEQLSYRSPRTQKSRS
jgi:predicted dithiol-disulfide oxidoreductase (DUF899 family)